MRDVCRSCAKRMKATLLTAILILSTFAIVITAFAQPEVWVDDDADLGWYDSTHFLTIQEGVDNVDSLGTVFVADGAYAGDVIVTVLGITIKGESLGAILTGGFNLQADDITIDGLTIDGMLSFHPSSIYFRADTPTIGSTGHKIINNEIIGSDVSTSGHYGITLLPSGEPSNILVDGNEIHGCRIAIIFDDSNGNTITNNEIYDNMIGIELTNSNDSVIMYNDIHDNSQFACSDPGGYNKIGYGVGCPSGTLVENSVNYNDIYDNDFGMRWLGDSELDATLNWWGTTDYPAIEEMIDGDVEYIPCLGASIEVTPLQIHYEFEPENAGDPVDVTATGDGSFIVPDTDTSVYYDDADECIITVEDLDVDDVDEATFAAIGEYVDVKIDDPGAVDELLIKVYHTDAELAASGLNEAMLIMYWYDGTEWLPCSETGVNTDNNYIWAKIRDDTSPSLAQMTGTEFGPGGALAIEYDFYHLDDDVTVTFVSVDENVDPEAIENVAVWAGSDTDLAGATIALRETGVDTGIFTGTFKLVGVTPATGEIVVNDGDGIRIHYDDGTDQYWDDATVDDTNPTVDDLFPGKDAITTDNHTTISAYVADAYLKVAWMTVDGVFRGTPITSSGTLDYTPYTLNPLPEGLHNVVVHAEDEAGNVNSTIWYFTVDVVKPTATISMNFTGDVKAGDVKFYAEFSEGMKNETGIAFISNVTSIIDFAASGKWTANQTYTIKAEILESYNGTAQVNATLAKDLAENVMTKASYTFYIDTVDPTAPGKLNATALADSVALEWLASADFSGVDNYTVYRGTETGACDTLLGSSPHPTVTFKDTKNLESGIYFYEVKAYDEAGNSAISNEANATFIAAPIAAYNVSLTKDWNLFSLPLIPDNASIEAVLADVIANVEIVWSYQDGGWLRYLPAVPSLSILTDMEDGKGYWIQMATNDTLEVNGYELPSPDELPPVYPVVEGYNMIGFKSVDKMLINTYLTTIPALVRASSVCYGWDATLQAYEMVYLAGTEYAPFEPGQGYWLYLTEDANIAPPAS